MACSSVTEVFFIPKTGKPCYGVGPVGPVVLHRILVRTGGTTGPAVQYRQKSAVSLQYHRYPLYLFEYHPLTTTRMPAIRHGRDADGGVATNPINARRGVCASFGRALRRPPPGSQDWSGHLRTFCNVGALDQFGKGGIPKVSSGGPTVDGGHIAGVSRVEALRAVL
jgi:hypothetical protein